MNGASLKRLVESEGAEGFYRKVVQLLDEKKVTVDDFSYGELAEACGVRGNLRNNAASMLAEASPGASTALFPVVTSELLGRKIIEGYENDEDWIGHHLVTVSKGNRVRNQKIAGFTALAGPLVVEEGHPYEDSTFDEKYVTSAELKKGRILSINEELIDLDQTGEINRRAMLLGYYLRQDKERFIVRQVQDVDQTVYRPSGTATALYSSANQNYIGVGGATGYDAAVPLVDHTDIDHIRQYRATQVKDDRVDGTPLPITTRVRQLLVPEALDMTARTVVNATQIRRTADSKETIFANPVPNLAVLSSPFVDEVDADNYYAGDFKRQFLWTEIWPVQTFLQRGDSEARFERDVILRVKVREYGGISAVETRDVTKIDGA